MIVTIIEIAATGLGLLICIVIYAMMQFSKTIEKEDEQESV